MRRFVTGFMWGLVFGGLLAYLYQKYYAYSQKTLVTRPLGVESPPDDFASLRGIGKGFAQKLKQAGIRTFSQLAQLSPEEVARLCQVPLWRVRQDDWIGQAAAQLV